MDYETYERLEMDVTKFDAEDVITTSGIGGGGGGGTGGGGSDTPGGGGGGIPLDPWEW